MKKSAVIKLYAGLGNQIFQYVYGQYLSKQGIKIKFLQDTKVDDFSLIFKTDTQTIGQCTYIKTDNSLHIITLKIFYKYIQRNYYTGYYQDKKYALDLKSEMQNILKFKNEEVYKATAEYKSIESSKAVSLHIRGGDYLCEPKYAHVCTSTYYKNAVEKIMQKVHNPQFFIFTNDKAFAQNILADMDIQVIFIENQAFAKDPGFDLFLLSHCKHNIIANSTFSWWGAFLNQYADKIVICPKKWTNAPDDVIENLAMTPWIKIESA